MQSRDDFSTLNDPQKYDADGAESSSPVLLGSTQNGEVEASETVRWKQQ